MSDAVAVATPSGRATLSDLIHDAFIDPIRSVLIIDDEYPTWEQIFGEESYDRSDQKWMNRADILQVIGQFRVKSPAMTVDIHDGREKKGIGDYLHQSDLLVLDYQLEKSEPHGEQAKRIIREILSNRHFNLVVIHTAIEDLSDPFNSILMSLLPPSRISPEIVDAGGDLVTAYEESGVAGSDVIVQNLKQYITLGKYLAYRKHQQSGIDLRRFFFTQEMADFKLLFEKIGWKPQQAEAVFRWVTREYEAKLTSSEGTDVRWSSPDSSKCPWIRTSGAFIAFTRKTDRELLSTLGKALEDWKPSPSRMISSKIRAEISAQGVIAEDSALADRHAYWRFYQELIKASGLESKESKDSYRSTLIEAHAARHTERLLDMIGLRAIEFGLKVVESDPTLTDGQAAGFSSHYSVDSTDAEKTKAFEHYNSYVSTKPVSGWHLQPGHIISFEDELWVCVSPACDLVPMQKGSVGIRGSIRASTKPFIGVKLHHHSKPTEADVNSNKLVFLFNKQANKIDTLSAYPSKNDNSSPIWRMFLASAFGRFTPNQDGTKDVEISFLCGDEATLKIETKAAKIVGHLRYEYALNLIQKLGIEFTRIGLDFVAPMK